MLDTAQIFLLFVIVVLTLLLLILGVQVFMILRELKHTVNKANKVLDDAGLITESVSGPISSLSTLATGVKAGTLVAKLFKSGKKSSSKEDEEDE